MALDATDEPIATGNVYYDSRTKNYVQIDEIWVDEDGDTQIRATEYRETQLRNAVVNLSFDLPAFREAIMSDYIWQSE